MRAWGGVGGGKWPSCCRCHLAVPSSISASARPQGLWVEEGREQTSCEVARPGRSRFGCSKDPPLSSGPRMRTEWWSWVSTLHNWRPESLGRGGGPSSLKTLPHVPTCTFVTPVSWVEDKVEGGPRIALCFPRERRQAALKRHFQHVLN